jgi:2-polyprenyl-3-methyl-5-hydroxy-6-metoxy-1,4-benzoquinol methylase
MTSSVIEGKIIHRETPEEIRQLLADCRSVLMVGSGSGGVAEFFPWLTGTPGELNANDRGYRLEKKDWKEIVESADSPEFDCVIAFSDSDMENFNARDQILNTVSTYARKWLVVIVRNGAAMDQTTPDGHVNVSRVQMVDGLRGDGFRVYGLSGLKQLRWRNGKVWFFPHRIGNWLAARTQPIAWRHPRQSFRLLGIKNPKEDINDYYKNCRYEMAAYIPPTTKRVLDVGCGAGSFGKVLKESGVQEVWGIEYSKDAASIASKKLDKVIQGDIIDALSELPDGYFDVIVFNDVLEHLVDPYTVLSSLKKVLNKQGMVVASIPNVRHISVLKDLLWRKEWEYRDSGVLDRTHLRFFTRKSIVRMFTDAGYVCQKIEGINREYTPAFFLLNLLLLGNALDARFTQYSCMARPLFEET